MNLNPSQWLDIGVIAVAFIAAVSGWRSGALGSLMSFVGVILGAVAGIMLAKYLVMNLEGDRTRLFATLILMLALVVIGEVAGVVLGRAMRGAIRNRVLRTADSTVGMALQVVAVLVAAWLLSIPMKSSNQPNIAAAARDSKILSQVDKWAPAPLRQVPDDLTKLLNQSGFTEVLRPFGKTPIAAVEPPDPTLADGPVVRGAEASVVKIKGVARSCQKSLEGTGFVIAPHRVISNAHVVAGTDSVTVETSGQTFEASVVSYDPSADISILAAPELPAAPLVFAPAPARTGDSAIVLGYPGGGDYLATPARIREIIELNGPDIYRSADVTREVYTIRGSVLQGNSGGPLIDAQGRVLGVVFGAAIDNDDTGFALTARQIKDQIAKAGFTEPVGTGTCVSPPSISPPPISPEPSKAP
jgi:S1-C subfamily serine protease